MKTDMKFEVMWIVQMMGISLAIFAILSAMIAPFAIAARYLNGDFDAPAACSEQ